LIIGDALGAAIGQFLPTGDVSLWAMIGNHGQAADVVFQLATAEHPFKSA
jgi:hypothetical protein